MHHDPSTVETDPVIDLIRTQIPDDAPDWTENIAWWIHDPAAGIAIYAHLGRLQPDRTIWEGLSLIFLPDGGMLVNRSLGVSLAAARTRDYDYRPLLPTKLWRFDFDGVAQRVDPQALRQRPLGDEPFERAAYALTFEAVQPVFNMHKSDATSERMHLEHGGRIQGMVTIGGARHAIDCTAIATIRSAVAPSPRSTPKPGPTACSPAAASSASSRSAAASGICSKVRSISTA